MARASVEKLRCLLRSRSGATAIEYCLIAAFISIAIAATLPGIGTGVEAMLAKVLAAF